MKLRERTITRTLTVTTCKVTIYEKSSKEIMEVTALVTGYTAPTEIKAYLESMYNTTRYVVLDYSMLRRQVLKSTMSEETFRLNASSWITISDTAMTSDEIEG